MKAVTIALWSVMILPASIFTASSAQADQSSGRKVTKESSVEVSWTGGYRYGGNPSRQPTRSWALRIDHGGNCLLAVSESTMMHELACSWSADATSIVVAAKDPVAFGVIRFDAGVALFRLDALATVKVVTRWLGLDESDSCRNGEECLYLRAAQIALR